MTYPQPQQPAAWPLPNPILEPPKKRSKWPLAATIAALLVAGFTALIIVVVNGDDNRTTTSGPLATPTPDPILEQVHKDCVLPSASATLGDGGHTLTIDGEGDENPSGLPYSKLQCTLNAIKMPASIRSRLGATRALDGMQTANWDTFSATWNYHPDSGLNLVLTSTK